MEWNLRANGIMMVMKLPVVIQEIGKCFHLKQNHDKVTKVCIYIYISNKKLNHSKFKQYKIGKHLVTNYL